MVNLRVLVAGAAGFLGSHLCDELLNRGAVVLGVDDLSSGTTENLKDALANRKFEFREVDVIALSEDALADQKFDVIFNLASIASPALYMKKELHTLKTGSIGTLNLLQLAKQSGARFVMASTSEIYGDPQVHPQHENYYGNVNPIGDRACYDESKRFSEALCRTFRTTYNVNVGIMRIFNTYGPRLHPGDGRVISNILRAAATGTRFRVNGTGEQTRSFCYVDDLIDAMTSFATVTAFGPVNLGNPTEITILELVSIVEKVTGTKIHLEFVPSLSDDPTRRRPDISRAYEILKWEPKISLEQGLLNTYHWMGNKAEP